MSGQDDEYLPVLAALERLRRDDAALYGRPNWHKMRRLVIVAECCKEEPLIEAMNTDPPCVLVGQITYGRADPDRKPWWGARRGDQGSCGCRHSSGWRRPTAGRWWRPGTAAGGYPRPTS
jgi:hypothetical protein